MFILGLDNIVGANLEYEMQGGLMKCGSCICQVSNEKEGNELVDKLNELVQKGDTEALKEILLSHGVHKHSMAMTGCIESVNYLHKK